MFELSSGLRDFLRAAEEEREVFDGAGIRDVSRVKEVFGAFVDSGLGLSLEF